MMESYRVRIEGIAPLLQHRFAGADAPEPKARQRRGVTDYREEAKTSLYHLDDGTIYEPSDHIEAAMTKAASSFKIPGKRNLTYRDLVSSSVIIEPSAIPHLHQEWAIENNGMGRRVRIGKAGVVRYRPEFKTWALEFTIKILDDELPASVVRDILDLAGRSRGIGDYRPKFGRFVVTHWEKA